MLQGRKQFLKVGTRAKRVEVVIPLHVFDDGNFAEISGCLGLHEQLDGTGGVFLPPGVALHGGKLGVPRLRSGACSLPTERWFMLSGANERGATTASGGTSSPCPFRGLLDGIEHVESIMS